MERKILCVDTLLTTGHALLSNSTIDEHVTAAHILITRVTIAVFMQNFNHSQVQNKFKALTSFVSAALVTSKKVWQCFSSWLRLIALFE